jgi:polysaccharide export outer membrane protein
MKPALLALLALLGACATARHDYDYSKEVDPRKNEYVIGVSDRLAVQVWRNPDLSRDVTVRPDGTITMPLIGDVAAAGKTPTELKNEITRELGRYVRDDTLAVTVAVTAVNSYSFTVSGNVIAPGVFVSQKYVTVLDAIQLAGGPNRFASPADTQLMRRDKDGKLRTIPINYLTILDGSYPEANLTIIAGDQIYVP